MGAFAGLPEPEKLTDEELDSLPFLDLFSSILHLVVMVQSDSSVKMEDFT